MLLTKFKNRFDEFALVSCDNFNAQAKQISIPIAEKKNAAVFDC